MPDEQVSEIAYAEEGAEVWGEYDSIRTAEDYLDSLRGRRMKIFLMGELIDEPVDHPIIRPSVNAVAETYRLAEEDAELATAPSRYTGEKVNRFLHIIEGTEDLVQKARMQRTLGQHTGTCFQRCVGLDAINALHSVTYEIDEKHGTAYHDRLLNFITRVQRKN